MPANYYAPAFQVLVNGSGLAADVSKNVTNVTITNRPLSLDEFNLTLANSYPKMRWTHTDDANLFREGNSIKIKMGYVDNLQLLFDGEITGINPTFPESGTPTVTIRGHSRLHWLNRENKTRTFRDVTDKQIVERIANDAGLTPKAEDPGVPYPYVLQQNETDLKFLFGRAGLIHYELFCDGKDLVFRPAQSKQSPAYTLVWGRSQGPSDPSRQVMYLRSFQPDMDTMNQPSSVEVRSLDPMTRETITGRAGIGDEEQTGGESGPQVGSQAFSHPSSMTVVNRPVASQAEADQMARALYNRQAADFVRGQGTTIGLPDLRAGQMVQIEGVGPRFRGAYNVIQVTHTISSGGYLTSFQVRRPWIG